MASFASLSKIGRWVTTSMGAELESTPQRQSETLTVAKSAVSRGPDERHGRDIAAILLAVAFPDA